MISQLFRYLFPRVPNRNRLPLLPLDYSSTVGPTIPDDLAETVRLLKGHAVARTDQDAMRLLKRYPGATVRKIIQTEKRQRKRQNRLVVAVRRLKKLW